MKPEVGDDEKVRAESLARGFLRGDLSRRDFLRRAGGFSAAALASTSLGPCWRRAPSRATRAAPPARAAAPPQDRSSRVAPCRRRSPESRTRSTPRRRRSTPARRSTTTSSASSSTSTPTVRSCGVLATDWNADDDTTWTFNLVDNATFHNGETFTADDVKYTFERILDPKTASSYSPLYDTIKSVEVASPDPGGLPPEVAVRPVPVEPGEQRRDREPEGGRGGGSRAQPRGHRTVQVRRVGAGRSHHAREVRRVLQGGQAVPRRDRLQVPAGGPGPDRRAERGRAQLGRRGAVAEPLDAVDRPVVHLRHVGHGGHPGLPGAEHRAGAVRRQARPAGGVLGARPDADPRRRVLGRGRGGDRRGPDRIHLVRRNPARHTRPRQGERPAAAGRPRRTASRSSTSACRNTPSC